MEVQQERMLQSLRAVKAFLDANADKLGGVVNTGYRKKLDDAIAELASFKLTQGASDLDARTATRRQLALRTVLLRDHMKPIAKIAAAELPTTPDMQPLRMPRGRPTAEHLAGLAHAMGEVAAKYAVTFTDGALPPDFVAKLKAAADAMLLSLDSRFQSRVKRTGATRALDRSLKHGRRVVGVLDALIQTAAVGDEELIGKWNSVKRVQEVPGGQPAAPAV